MSQSAYHFPHPFPLNGVKPISPVKYYGGQFGKPPPNCAPCIPRFPRVLGCLGGWRCASRRAQGSPPRPAARPPASAPASGGRCPPVGGAAVRRRATPCASLPPRGWRLRPPRPPQCRLTAASPPPFLPPLGRPVRPLFGGRAVPLRGAGAAGVGGSLRSPPTDPTIVIRWAALLLCARSGFGLLSLSFRLMGWPWVRVRSSVGWS